MSRIMRLIGCFILLSSGPLLGQQVTEVSTYSITALSSSVSEANLAQDWKRSLISMLADAEDSYRRGDIVGTVEMVETFRDEVQVQTPIFIETPLAEEWNRQVEGIRMALERGLPLGGIAVDRAGGVLRVSDPNSPAMGTELTIPADALRETTFVSISVAPRMPANPLMTFAGGVTLGPRDVNLAALASLSLPYRDQDGDRLVDGMNFPPESLKVAVGDSLGRIGFVQSVLAQESQTLTIPISRFSTYRTVAWRWNSPQELTYKFSWPNSGVALAPGYDLEPLKNMVRQGLQVWGPAMAQAGFTFREVGATQPAAFRFVFFSSSAPQSRGNVENRLLSPMPAGTGEGIFQVYGFENPAEVGTFFDIAFNSDFSGIGSPDEPLVWTGDNSGVRSAVSIEMATIHAVGHVLGLGHNPPGETREMSAMSDRVNLLRPAICLSRRDVQTFRQLYDNAPSSTPFPPCPHVALAGTPTEFDFGEVEAGTSAETQFTVRNEGTGTLVITSVVAEGPFEVDVSETAMNLESGQSTTFAAIYAPEEGIGFQEGALRILSNDPDSPTSFRILGLTPTEVPACTLTASPAEISRGRNVTLSWSTTNLPSDGTIDPAVGPVDLGAGSAVVTPAGPTEYTMSVSNSAGAATCSASVDVGGAASGEVVGTWQYGTEGEDRIHAITSDASGIFATGSISSGTDSMNSGFIFRYDQNGTLTWDDQIPGSSAEDVAVFESAAYIAGSTEAALSDQSSAGVRDAFLRKYTLDGEEVWTRQFGTALNDSAIGIGVDASGVVVAGVTEGAMSGETSAGSSDIFLRKYDLDGNVLWTDQFGTPGADLARDIAVVPGGIFLVGDTAGALPGQTSAGSSDAFVRHYDGQGTEIWTRQFGSPSSEFVEGVAVDGSSVFIAGETEAAFTMTYNVFLRRYSLDGAPIWDRTIGTSSSDYFAAGVVSDGSGVFLAGETEGTFPTEVKSGPWDLFLRKYDADGNELWTRQFGTSDLDDAFDVTVDSDAAYVAGGTTGTLPGYQSGGASDAFIIKIAK